MKTKKNQLRYEGRPRDSGVSGTQLASVGFGEGNEPTVMREGTGFVSPRKVSSLYPQSMERHPNAQVRELHEKDCI